MDAETFLSHALDELDQVASVIEPVDEYRVIRASGLLRLLLADSASLLDQVAWARHSTFRVYHPDTPFHVSQTSDDLNDVGNGMFMTHWLAPRTGSTHEDLSRAEFLAHLVASSTWTGPLTVKTVIRVGATAFGGVHLTTPIEPEEEQVAAVVRELDEGREPDTNALCTLLREICATVVESLQRQRPT